MASESVGSAAGEHEGKMKPMRVGAYIRQLTNECRRVVPVSPAPYICRRRHVTDEYNACILIGDVASQTNI
jgi:hypothetical protein